jgi:hypothetical protein
MKGATEKLAIEITESGEVVLKGQNSLLKLTAGEAIMLLDILRNEEGKLKKMAEEASPLCMHHS